MTIPPFLQTMLDDLEYTLLVQLGVSFSVPILIWILVTFRREDLFNPPQPKGSDRK